MTEDIKKSKAGRKGNAVAKDLTTLIAKAEYEVAKYDSRCCNRLPELYEMLESIAFGTGKLGKNASPSNRKTAISEMIARGESYANGTAELLVAQNDKPTVEETLPEETKQVANGSPEVVDNESFEAKKKAWLAEKAKKEAEKED